jgi:quercetin dioxygenase-like cupin family protein
VTTETGVKRKRLVVFHTDEAEELGPEIMPREGIDDSVLDALTMLADAGVTEGVGESTRLLFKEPGEQGMSLVLAWFKSNYVLPFHSHNTDCLYYVLGGELRMGSHVLRKGDGFFIPRDQGYGYEAGPDGVEVLEFRNATHFNLMYGANDDKRWQRIAETFRDRADIWASETLPPSDRGA